MAPRLPTWYKITYKDEEKSVDLVVTARTHHADGGDEHDGTPRSDDEVWAIQ